MMPVMDSNRRRSSGRPPGLTRTPDPLETDDEFRQALQKAADPAKQTLNVNQIGQLGIGIFSFLQLGRRIRASDLWIRRLTGSHMPRRSIAYSRAAYVPLIRQWGIWVNYTEGPRSPGALGTPWLSRRYGS